MNAIFETVLELSQTSVLYATDLRLCNNQFVPKPTVMITHEFRCGKNDEKKKHIF